MIFKYYNFLTIVAVLNYIFRIFKFILKCLYDDYVTNIEHYNILNLLGLNLFSY